MRLAISPILFTLIPLCLAAAPCTSLPSPSAVIRILTEHPHTAYFYITKPAAGDQWTQGQPHAANWIHAVDGVDVIDVELGRTSTSGLLLAAREGARIYTRPPFSFLMSTD